MCVEDVSIWEGIVVGGVGGAVAGLTVNIASWIAEHCRLKRDKAKVHAWLSQHTSDEENKRYRSTRAIASWNNLTEDRVRYVCSHDERIYLSTGQKEDMWGIHGRPKLS